MRNIITQTDRLQLCAPKMADLDRLAELWSDAETMRFISPDAPWTRQQVQERLERSVRICNERGIAFWTVIEKSNSTIIGQGGLTPISFKGDEIELGYRLGRDFWGKGYATEIARASIDYGFETLKFDRLVAVCYEGNLGSRRVLSKAGFRELGESDDYYGVRTILHECTPYDPAV
jgi:RimJ/RimL family protein N-acetyltransferase